MSQATTNFQTSASPFLKDVHTFLNYCEKTSPRLTPTKEYLNRRSLWELNEQLSMPATDVNQRNDQEYYFPINFYFHLVKEAGFFQIDRTKKKAYKMVMQVDRLQMFRALSPTAQYFFLLKSYWAYCDWEDMANPNSPRVSLYRVKKVLKIMQESKANKVYTNKGVFEDILNRGAKKDGYPFFFGRGGGDLGLGGLLPLPFPDLLPVVLGAFLGLDLLDFAIINEWFKCE